MHLATAGPAEGLIYRSTWLFFGPSPTRAEPTLHDCQPLTVRFPHRHTPQHLTGKEPIYRHAFEIGSKHTLARDQIVSVDQAVDSGHESSQGMDSVFHHAEDVKMLDNRDGDGWYRGLAGSSHTQSDPRRKRFNV
jgi:hypothetical protein